MASTTSYISIVSIMVAFALILSLYVPHYAYAISIKPADFDRLIMPCYLGGSSSSYNPTYGGSSSAYGSQGQVPQPSGYLGSNQGGQFGRQSNGMGAMGANGLSSSSSSQANGYQAPATYFAPETSRSSYGGSQNRDIFSNLGQHVPRANTIDNFIALVSKIEQANPRLARDIDQLIRTLLGRFRLDNYYYDVRSRTPISDPDRRFTDIQPALLNSNMPQMQSSSQYILSSGVFPENLLDHDEKCSMYFMLSHFIDKGVTSASPLAGIPVQQLTGPLGNQKPPVLQAAGSGYPAQSANQAYSGGSPNAGARYPGPSPSFGSPATSNMNSFGNGINNNPDYNSNSKNPYGVNVPQPNNQFNLNYNNMRQTGQYSGTATSNTRLSTPYIDGMARNRDERSAIEYGVVTTGNQDNAALVLNRVLLGILASTIQPQAIRQLANMVYPTQSLTNTPMIDQDIDPLFAVTLADLWAISSIPKPGKPSDIRSLGDNGHWNDTMCPTSFQLERSNSIRFTTAELIGGLDGFTLGMFRRRLLSMKKDIRLSEMLRIYYSKIGFRPQFPEVGVCNRAASISTQLDDLHRQAENYLRLYDLNTPIADNEISSQINRMEAFRDFARQTANQYAPPEICSDSGLNDLYPMNSQEQCEIGRADVVTVLDTSPQANQVFENLVVAKLAHKLGLSREGNSFSVMTNQQDTTGYAGAYSFNSLVRNSTNTAEIGCALTHDTSQSYQGGQITDPTRLVEMFERALITLDSEYITRQTSGLMATSTFGSQPQSTYVSSWFGSGSDGNYMLMGGGGQPKTTGGAKIIVWFSYGTLQKPSQIAPSPTNWNPNNGEQNQYKFLEAKKYLRENFRGASVLAVATSREEVKAFVYDEERDIFTDIPQGNSGGSSSASFSDYYPPSLPNSDPSNGQLMSGPADQLVSKLLQRMCTVPATFQYPMCFRVPSADTMSVGYISPGRKQYWMMSPKTFFASRYVRMVFKVEGGRLRVCFGRKPNPDETAMRNGQQYQSGGISFNGRPNGDSNGVNNQQNQASTNDYYTGSEYGVCKDVSPGQEVDFVVSDPCYKKSIAECEPFYYVVKELSNPGEGDPNYMCRDEGCKRFDQVKFILKHTGVTCSSALKAIQTSWFLLIACLLVSLGLNEESRQTGRKLVKNLRCSYSLVIVALVTIYACTLQQVQAQQAGVYDFGLGRYGEKRGNLTPSEVAGLILIVMFILGGLAITIGLCYYTTRRNRRQGMTRVKQDEY